MLAGPEGYRVRRASSASQPTESEDEKGILSRAGGETIRGRWMADALTSSRNMPAALALGHVRSEDRGGDECYGSGAQR